MTLLQVAETAGYETVEDFLSDTAWVIRGKLADLGVNTFNISLDDIAALLADEGGDVDAVISGYLDA